MRVAAHHSEQQLVDQELRAELAKRLRTMLLAQQGFTAPEIATCTGFSWRKVQTWVARYVPAGNCVLVLVALLAIWCARRHFARWEVAGTEVS